MARIAWLAALAGVIFVQWSATAEALDCRKARSAVEKAVCASPALREQDRVLGHAYAEALARAPDRADAIRDAQRSWLADRDAACGGAKHKRRTECIETRYRARIRSLTELAAAPAAPAPRAAPETQSRGGLRPQDYISDAVLLRLEPDGRFEMRELAGSRRADGHYRYDDGILTLLDASGDIGSARFPMYCRVRLTGAGFALAIEKGSCRQLDGAEFRAAG